MVYYNFNKIYWCSYKLFQFLLFFSSTTLCHQTHQYAEYVRPNTKEIEESIAHRNITNVIPPEKALKLFALNAADNDPLLMIFTGDTQYHFPCTDQNNECKKHSASCVEKYNKENHLVGITTETTPDHCIKLESQFANEVQRKSIFDLARKLKSLVNTTITALVINGDLTNFGHSYQLDYFKTEWLSLPIPVYAGLGNHDYENNVNECLGNQCANVMLRWFVKEYAPKLNLQLDYSEKKFLWKNEYAGSMAYSTNFCSKSQSNCVFHIQLNNRPDYANHIEASAQWIIRSSFGWLLNHLDAIININKTWPILINMHDFSENVESRLTSMLKQWLNKSGNSSIIQRIIILFAHTHERHSIRIKCIGGIRIPLIFVGSVPNNRYTLIRFSGDIANIFLLQANSNLTTSVMDVTNYKWRPC